MSFKKILALLLKIAVTVAFMWLVFQKINIGLVFEQIVQVDVFWAMLAVLALITQLILAGVRWYLVGSILNIPIPLHLATSLVLIGQFFNQILPGGIGGDAVRAWMLTRRNFELKRALISVVCDRSLGLLILFNVAALTLPFLTFFDNVQIPHGLSLMVAFLSIAAIGMLTLILQGDQISDLLRAIKILRPLGAVVSSMRSVFVSGARSTWALVLSIGIQFLVILSIYLGARSLHIEFNLQQVLLLPVIILIGSLPISFAGWGLRESAMVTGLGFVAISPVNALSVSILFGLGQIVISIPGIILTIKIFLGSVFTKLPASLERQKNLKNSDRV